MENQRPLLDCDTDELRGRLGFALDRLDAIFREVGPVLQEMGLLRSEVQLIYDELLVRGVVKDESDIRETVRGVRDTEQRAVQTT